MSKKWQKMAKNERNMKECPKLDSANKIYMKIKGQWANIIALYCND